MFNLGTVLEKVTEGFSGEKWQYTEQWRWKKRCRLMVHVCIADLNKSPVVSGTMSSLHSGVYGEEGTWMVPSFTNKHGIFLLFIDSKLKAGEVVLRLNSPWPYLIEEE